MFFPPTLAGNVFGGTVLFPVLSQAQAREEIFEEGEQRRPAFRGACRSVELAALDAIFAV